MGIHFGGIVNLEADYSVYNSIGNNPIAYDASISIKPSLKFNFLDLFLDVDVPLISYTLRPKSKGFVPTDNGDVNLLSVLENGRVQTLNNYFYIHANFGVYFRQIKLVKSIQFFYDFKGGMNKSSSYRGFTQHTIGLKFWFNNTKFITIKCQPEE